MWVDLLTALALVCVIEGIMPFLNPAGLRKVMLLAAQLDDMSLRIAGLSSMIMGILLLYLVH